MEKCLTLDQLCGQSRECSVDPRALVATSRGRSARVRRSNLVQVPGGAEASMSLTPAVVLV